MITQKTRIVGSIGIGQTFGWGTTFYLPAVLAESIGSGIDIRASTVYMVLSGAIIISALLGPLSGRTIDRHGGRVVLCTSSLLFACGLFSLGASYDLASFIFSWVLIGVGMSMGLYEAAFASLARIYGDDSRSAITGITLMAGLASSIFWPLSAYIDSELGWRMVCFIWAGCHLFICFPLYFLAVPKVRSSYSGIKVQAHNDQAFVETAKPPLGLMIVISLTFTALFIIFSGMATHLPRLLQEAGATKAMAIGAAAMMGPAQIVGRLLDFMFIKHFHPVMSARIAVFCHPIGAIILLAVGAPASMLFAFMHGMGSGILTIVTGTIPLALFGAASFGLRQGLLLAPGRIGMALAPFLFAVCIDVYGSQTVLITSGLSALALIGLLYIPLRRHSEVAVR